MNLPRHAYTFVALGVLGGLALGASTGIAFGIAGSPGAARSIAEAGSPGQDAVLQAPAEAPLASEPAEASTIVDDGHAASTAPSPAHSSVRAQVVSPESAQESAPPASPPASSPPAAAPPANAAPATAPPAEVVPAAPPPAGSDVDTSSPAVPATPPPPGLRIPADTIRITNAEEPTPAARNKIMASRRPTSDDKVILGFKEVAVPETIRFIVESTGKVVMTRLTQIQPTKITLLNDQPISRHEALDLLFKSFRLNNIGVVETEREIIIDLLTEIPKIQDPGVVLGPDESVMDRTDDGLIISKIFPVRVAKADVLIEQIKEFLPDYATVTVDANSNQIVLQGNVGVAKRVQLLLDALDKPPHIPVETRTFRLAYADAESIATVILDLFQASASAGNRQGGGAALGGRQQQQGGRQPPRPGGGAAGGGAELVGTSEQLRVTTLPQINAVVVSAEPEILREIEKYIIGFWDIPLSKSEGDLFRVYSLRYADPLVVRDVLQTMLEGGTTGGSRGGAGGGRGGTGGAGGRAGVGGGGGGGGGGDADAAVANIFRIEAIPDNRQLVVVSRTPENFAWLSQVIEQIDQPTKAGLPVLVQLKHANAVEVSEQLNALLAPEGAQASITDQQTGLNLGQQFANQLNSGPSAGGGTGGGGATGGTGGNQAAEGEITFPWQSTQGAGAGETTPPSSIIGKVRIVPIIRQNALSILATPEMQQAVLDIVTALDRPGRQVLVAAVIASVELKDEFAYGLRVSPDGVVSPLADNSFGGSVANANVEDPFFSNFTSSVLNLDFDAQILVQALDQKTNAKVLQSPKLFISDNQEGVFFVGQDVPIITDTQVTDVGGTVNSFDYQQVGVLLNVRPRITQQRDVSMEINLTLSNIVSGLIVNGGQVFDRRTTQTQLTVKNGQTIVLSGIRVETQSDVKRRVPVLGYAPVIGDLLFTSTDTANNVQELLAFITPIVVDNPDENDANFNNDARRRLDELKKPMPELIKEGLGGDTFDPKSTLSTEPPLEPRAPADPTILLDGGTVPAGQGSGGGAGAGPRSMAPSPALPQSAPAPRPPTAVPPPPTQAAATPAAPPAAPPPASGERVRGMSG